MESSTKPQVVYTAKISVSPDLSYIANGFPRDHEDVATRNKLIRTRDENFTDGLDDTCGYFVCVKYDSTTQELVCKHYGPHALYNRAKMKCFVPVGAGIEPPKWISLSSTAPVQFDEVRIVISKTDRLPYESPPVVPRATFSTKPTATTTTTSSSSSSPWAAKVMQGVKQMFSWIWPDTEDPEQKPKAMCRDGLQCGLHYHKRLGWEKHSQEFSHLCLYGASCDQLKSPEHCTNYLHLKKDDTCPVDKCTKKTDPIHRLKFHHQGLWDFLLECKDGPRCKKKHDAAHCLKYSHGDPCYLKKDGTVEIRSVAARDSRTTTTTTTTSRADSETTVRRGTRGLFNPAQSSDTAQLDGHGNPLGSNYDLGRDGAFTGHSILVLNFFGLPWDHVEKSLKRKGFRCDVIGQLPDEDELDSKLRASSQLWLVPGPDAYLTHRHIEVIKQHLRKGTGLYLWAGDKEFSEDAYKLAWELFGVMIEREQQMDQLCGVDTADKDSLIRHDITQGVDWLAVGRSVAPIHDQNSTLQRLCVCDDELVIGVYDDGGQQRAVVDGQVTRLSDHWDTPGTERYVVNVACWLVNPETTTKPPPPPRKPTCKYGAACTRKNPQHLSDYSHPPAATTTTTTGKSKFPCRYGADCYNNNADHRAKYSHPPATKKP
eukprot:TRINITY_DN67935_c10_g3_i1.p1 TRINITY_DN67935_c10_g3~~TRINITY_DN67935_c10_g3_i1.p1  ORF type:complete len:698 (+),score=14.98 TRINITY_DN67935_c10_g3_i1:130-2094(+)